jgi:hypothetical protein
MKLVHVRCGGYGVVKKDGKFALLLNQGRLERDKERVFTPIGGGLQATPKGMAFLRKLGATDFESEPDIRLMLPENRVDEMNTWFIKRDRTMREISMLREMSEELTQEMDILTETEMNAVKEKEHIRFLGFGSGYQRKKNKIRLADIYDVHPSKLVMDKLVAASTGPKPHVIFASLEDIKKGSCREEKIGSVSKLILTPKQSISIKL